MQRLFQLQEQLLGLTPTEIVRECASKINWDSQLVAIRGPKGVGKSTIIRQYIKQHGDFVVDGKYTFEVGGVGKNFKQIANLPNSFILADDMDFPFGNKLPLWLIGFLY